MTSSDTAIVVRGLGKQYRIGRRRDAYPTLRDWISQNVKSHFHRLRAVPASPVENDPNMIWALRDVSFDIKRGEIVGFIGRNGAGKSTLLKILSRITDPTRGWADIHGRVGSMLEVGTGFHPELTGRENLFLNGSILGMKRAEIKRKFDEIIAFSEVAPFIDTPVKHYSSGMYVRLAFAIAAHLRPDILMVDEVLAVGDARFQRKCLAKMDEIAKDGHTVLFVSHNMGLIRSLCSRGIFLREGSLYVDDTAANAVAAYIQSLEASASTNLIDRTERGGRGLSQLARIDIHCLDAGGTSTLVTGQPARFDFHVSRILPGMTCSFTIYDQHGQPATYFDSAIHSGEDSVNTLTDGVFHCQIEELLLVPGRYRINAAVLVDGEMQDHVEAASFFIVEQGAIRGRPVPIDASYGVVMLPHRWTTPC